MGKGKLVRALLWTLFAIPAPFVLLIFCAAFLELGWQSAGTTGTMSLGLSLAIVYTAIFFLVLSIRQGTQSPIRRFFGWLSNYFTRPSERPLPDWRSFIATKEDRWFWGTLIALTILITLYRYRDPGLLYPETGDAFWTFGQATSAGRQKLASIFAMHGPRAVFYALIILLQPLNPNFLPHSFPLFTYSNVGAIRHVMLMLGAVMIWLVPLAGFVAYRLTKSRVAGILTAFLMMLSPHQNLMVTELNPYVVYLIPLVLVAYRIWYHDPQEFFSARKLRVGLITGLLASTAINTLYHSWYVIIVSFGLIAIEWFVRRVRNSPKLDKAVLLEAVRYVFPYLFGLVAGLILPVLFLESVYWINRSVGPEGLMYADAGDTGYKSILGAYLSTGDSLRGRSSWDLVFLKTRTLGWFGVVFSLFGWFGGVLILAALGWSVIKWSFAHKESTPLSLPLTILLTYAVLHLPILPAYGRMAVPLEFPAFVLVSQLVTDVARAHNRLRLFILPIVILLSLMLAQMSISSYVALDDVLGTGRAARWLDEHPGKVYFTTGGYGGSPGLTTEQAKNLSANENGFLIQMAEPAPEWRVALRDVIPVRDFRTALLSWRSFDLVGVTQFDPTWGHVVIYDLQEIRMALNKSSP